MNFKKPKFWDYREKSFWSTLLLPLSIIYLLIVWIRKISSIFKTYPKYTHPIICVGNIYLGGTGKTPLASEIFKFLKSAGKNPAFIQKDYDYLFDEMKMLRKTGETFSSNDRRAAISLSILKGHDVAILDDGFQDFSIKKDFSILCFNSKQLIGNGFIIPSGPLRESIKSIKRADCIVINDNKNEQFENKINNINKNVKIFYSKYKIINLDKFKNKKIVAFAGIANPSNFFELLKENNLNIIKTHSFPDHHNYSQRELESIVKDSKKNLALIVTTEKDYSRMSDELKLICNQVKVDLEIKNKDEFTNLIKSKL